MRAYDAVIVGAGISGATLAERYASRGARVLVIERRDHIGGNCYDYYNSDGILVSKYGAHLFHTRDEGVWRYVNGFADWRPYVHKVLARVDGALVPIPVNITTVNTLFGLSIGTEEEMVRWLAGVQVRNGPPQNGEEAALARVGPLLYEKMFKHYTRKQWDRWPSELDPSVLERIPVRTNFDDRYFADTYQGLPVGGYAPLFARMLDHPNIDVSTGTDYFAVAGTPEIARAAKLFYTGPIDRYFDYRHGRGGNALEWRSIRFVWETHPCERYQCNGVINYPQPEDGGFTRIVEYKHLTGQQAPCTTISKEYSTSDGEPYYPVPSPANHALYCKYQADAARLPHVHFVGRLANYKYFNMDQAFRNALDLFQTLEGPEP